MTFSRRVTSRHLPRGRLTHGLLVFVAVAGLLLSSLPAMATTWYVRADGGTSTQCTGTSNAAYSGSGQHQACAFSHPFWALQPGQHASNFTPATVMKPGDTLVIGSGSYMIGYGAPNASNNMCYQPATWGCAIASIPSGIDAAHPTVVTGASCSAPPELWGTQRVFEIFDVEKVHDVTIKCLNLTDHSACIESYQPTANTGGVTACNRGSYPYGTWAADGIFAADVTNLTLQNLDIHGFADYGINAGRLAGNTLLDGVTVQANGWGGWSGDLGGGDKHGSTDSGTITVRNSTVAWNGCAEAYPATTIVGCWGQNQGGYGDGFAEAWTGGNWVFSNDHFIANTQDGLDLLYANGTGSITMDRLYAWENAGNGIKTAGTATLTNSIVNGYCNDWKGFPMYGDGSSGVAGTMCRADGTAVVMEFNAPNQKVTLAYNTITGDGDTLIVGGGADFNFAPTSSNVMSFYNNVLLGQTSVIPRDGGRPTGLAWFTDGSYGGVTNYNSNIIWNVRDNFCPAGNICQNPQLTNQTLADFDAHLLTSSPAIGNANRNAYNVTADYYGYSRAANGAIDIGAVAYRENSSSGGSDNGSGGGDNGSGDGDNGSGGGDNGSGGGNSGSGGSNGGSGSGNGGSGGSNDGSGSGNSGSSGGTQSGSGAPPPSSGSGPAPGNTGQSSGKANWPGGNFRVERYHLAGSKGWYDVVRVVQRSDLLRRATKSTSSKFTSSQGHTAPIPAAARGAVQPAAAKVAKVQPASHSYASIVYGWFVDVYNRYRSLLQR